MVLTASVDLARDRDSCKMLRRPLAAQDRVGDTLVDDPQQPGDGGADWAIETLSQ